MQSDEGKASGPQETTEPDQEIVKHQKAVKKTTKLCYPHLSPRDNQAFFSAKNLMIKLKPEHASMFEIEEPAGMSHDLREDQRTSSANKQSSGVLRFQTYGNKWGQLKSHVESSYNIDNDLNVAVPG